MESNWEKAKESKAFPIDRVQTNLQKGAASELAQFLESIKFDMIPESAIHSAKKLILDCITCMVGGAQLLQGRKMIDFFSGISDKEESTVVLNSKRMPSIHAGYVNSYLANLLDFDDTYFGHPGATVIPPALVLGEKSHVGGKDLLVAVVAAYEVGTVVADAIKPSLQRLKQVMGLSTWQVFCSVAAAGKLLGLNEKQMTNAFGLAAHNAPVPSVRKWGWENKDIHWMKNNYGWATMGGMMAAMMAQQGFMGDPTIFDGDKGFWIMAGSDQYNPISMKGGPREKWAVERVHLKPYTACRHIHPTLDAVCGLIKTGEFSVNDIRYIEVTTFFEVAENYNIFPKDPFTVPFSAPYLIALALLKVPAGLQWFEEKYLSNPQVKELANRVRFHPWPEADALYIKVKRELISRVEIETGEGRRFEKEVRLPKGDPRNPLTDKELFDKFFSLVGSVLGRNKATAIYEEVLNLEKMEDCATLAQRLR